MEIQGLKGNDPWMSKVMDRAERQGMNIKEVEGLL